MNNRCIPLLLAVVSAASLYGTTVHRSFRNGYPAEAKRSTVQGKTNPLAQPTKGAGPSQGETIDDSDWQKGPTEQWFVNWDKALAEAKAKNKPLFVLNTGSDWRRRVVREDRRLGWRAGPGDDFGLQTREGISQARPGCSRKIRAFRGRRRVDMPIASVLIRIIQ